MYYKLVIEAIVVGISSVIMGTIVSKVLTQFKTSPVSPSCKNWNKYYVMELALFLTGVFLHLIFEFIGANRWYCKKGHACS